MWLMLPRGALSITVSPKDPTKLQVRARRVEWLDAFREYCPELGPNIHTTHADYQWRALATPEAVAEGVKRATLAIDYSNFKNATASQQHGLKDYKLRDALHSAYSKIWSTLLAAGDGTSGYNTKYTSSSTSSSTLEGSGTISVCARLGHWWPKGNPKCTDCGATNPNYPHGAGPDDKPTQAEVKAWWAARRKKTAKPRVTKSTTSAKAQIAAPGEGWNVCFGAGQPVVKGSMELPPNGTATGTCRVCGATVPLTLDTWEARSHEARQLPEVV